MEGVADRVELHTGDRRALPFADRSFDAVLSSLPIHNIRGSAGREQAIAEALRLLRRRLGWQFWRGGAAAATAPVTVTKPEGPNPDGQAAL